MNFLRLMFLFSIVSCGLLKQTINPNSLSSTQRPVNLYGGETTPGCCYIEMISPNGIKEFYEIICFSDRWRYLQSSKCLIKLGYQIEGQPYLGKEYQKALIDFQKKHQLAYGSLDEATLRLLILATSTEDN